MPLSKSKWYRRPRRPLPVGKIVAKCIDCHGEGIVKVLGRPAVIEHDENCPEHKNNRQE